MPDTPLQEIQRNIRESARFLGEFKEFVQKDLTFNQTSLSRYLTIEGKTFSVSEFGKLDSLTDKISDILTESQEHFEISYTDPTTNKVTTRLMTAPFNRDSLTIQLKNLYLPVLEKQYANNVNTLIQKKENLFDFTDDIKNNEFFKGPLDATQLKDNKVFDTNLNETTNIGPNLTIKKCPPKAFSKDTYKKLQDLYIESATTITNISNRFKEVDDYLKDDTTPEEEINKKKDLEKDIGLIKTYIDTVEPVIQRNLNNFNATKIDDCNSVEELYMFSKLHNIDVSDIEVQKVGGNQNQRQIMSINFNGGDGGKLSEKREGFFTKTEKFSVEKNYEDFKKKIEGRFKTHYDGFFKLIINDYEAEADRQEAKWQENNKLDPKKKYSNIDKESRANSHDLFVHKPSYIQSACFMIDKIAEKVEVDDQGFYSIPENALADENDRDDKKQGLGNLYNDETKKKAWEYLQQNRNNQEFLASLADFRKTFKAVGIPSSINHNQLGIKDGSELAYRNCAMTAVSKALGFDCLADSYKVNISDNGKITEGVFMEKAKGVDFVNMADWETRDKILTNGFNDKRFLKSISDLQVLDYICGNVDRHEGNLFYKIDENNKICGVIGIDNDSSFGTKIKEPNQFQNMLMPIDFMKAIDQKTAEKVNKLTGEQLKGILSPFNLSKDEINASITRLNQLKTAIKLNDKVGGIKTFTDKDWENSKLDDLAYHGEKAKRNNTYSTIVDRIDKMKRGGTFFEYEKPNQLKERAKLIKTSLDAFSGELRNYEKELNNAKAFWNNSQKYKDLISTVSKLKEDMFVNVDDFSGRLVSRDSTYAQMKKYKENLSLIREKANDYLDHKKKDIDNNSLDKPSKKKVELVRNLLNTINQKESIIDNDFQKYVSACDKSIKISDMKTKEMQERSTAKLNKQIKQDLEKTGNEKSNVKEENKSNLVKEENKEVVNDNSNRKQLNLKGSLGEQFDKNINNEIENETSNSKVFNKEENIMQ